MIIVWSGWGALVAVFVVVGFFIGVPIGGLITPDENIGIGVAFITSGLLTGLGSFLLARKIESGESRAFIDEKTQERIVVRKSAGSLFFVPTRYWAYVAPVLGILLAVVMMMNPTTPELPGDLANAPAAPVSGTAPTA
ncbi:MAG: hypothetical protein EBR82_01940 [Caulobacteraceae bacterium]|nr:hypothetical protein [Caulobacteraceae bacterium]